MPQRLRPTRRCGASCGRDSGETYQEFLTRLAQASGIETPTRADLARVDRKRPKKGRNTDWRHPHDPDARITKMKDGRTHLAHKAEHAVDLETGAIVGVTVQGADQGDTTTIAETVTAAAEELEAVAVVTDGQTAVIDEVVADKGYHSNQVLVDLGALDLRTYIAEPNRGRRNWKKKTVARDAVYANRRRIRGARGLALQRRRSEHLERPNAHLYETGGLRRTHVRGHANSRSSRGCSRASTGRASVVAGPIPRAVRGPLARAGTHGLGHLRLQDLLEGLLQQALQQLAVFAHQGFDSRGLRATLGSSGHGGAPFVSRSISAINLLP